jgi:hypothetical protein
MFDNHQETGRDGKKWQGWPNSEFASVAVYLQAFQADRQDWLYQEFQIWRANTISIVTGEVVKESANVAVQSDVNHVLTPCGGDLDYMVSEMALPYNRPRIAGFRKVSDGSDDMDIGGEQLFDLLDIHGKAHLSGCVFKGEPYKPTAKDGLFAGNLVCASTPTTVAVKVFCTRPKEFSAYNCDPTPIEDCGTLGKDCTSYYQLLATCRM